VTCKTKDKIKISRGIVSAIRGQDPPGHFLEQDSVTGLWNDIGNKRAVEKTSQALREGQADILRKITYPMRQRSSSFSDANDSISSASTSLSDPMPTSTSIQDTTTSYKPISSGLATVPTPVNAFKRSFPNGRSNGISPNDDIDHEISDLIYQTFVEIEEDEFDEAIDEVMKNVPDVAPYCSSFSMIEAFMRRASGDAFTLQIPNRSLGEAPPLSLNNVGQKRDYSASLAIAKVSSRGQRKNHNAHIFRNSAA